MNQFLKSLNFSIFLGLCGLAMPAFSQTAPAKVAADPEAVKTEVVLEQPVHINGKVATLMAPKVWTQKKPRSKIVEHEFATKAAEGDQNDGRLTIMGSGGTIQANIDRWMGQFTQPDGTATKSKAKVSRKTISNQEIHLVDISGTYKDSPRGPFGPKVDRPGYRMLAAIVQLSKDSKPLGNYYIKLYGPEKTIAQNEKAFDLFLRSLKMN